MRNAWFDSGYICRVRRRVGSGMVFAGLLVTMFSRCVTSSSAGPWSLHRSIAATVPAASLPAGMWGRLFGDLCMAQAGGHVHRDMTSIIRCIRAVVSTKTLLLHLVRTTPTTSTATTTTQGSTRLLSFCGALFVEPLVGDIMADVAHAASAAKWRRERRLRARLRHERMAEFTHHSSRGQRTARAWEEVENATHDGLRAQKTPPPGVRPGIPLTAPCGTPRGKLTVAVAGQCGGRHS